MKMNGGDSMFFDCMDIVQLVSELLVAGVVKYVIEYPHKERQTIEDYDHLIKKLKLMSTEVRIMGFHNEEIHMPHNKLNDIELDALKRLEPKINNNYLNVMMLFTAAPLKDYTLNSKKEVDYEYINSQMEGICRELKCANELRISQNVINRIKIKLINVYKRILATRLNRTVDVVASMGYLVCFHQHFVFSWADGTLIGEYDYPRFSLVKI